MHASAAAACKMNIALISSRFAPEASPGAKRMTDLVMALQAAGHRTTVLTQLPHYPDPSAFQGFLCNAAPLRIDRDETGNEIWRFRPQLTSKADLPARLIAEARFAIRASRWGTRLSDLDGVVGSTPYMFNLYAARSYRLPMWLDLRDLTWEYSRDLGSGSLVHALGGYFLKSLSLANFGRASRVSTTTPRQRQYLIDNGVPADKVQVIPNGVPKSIVERLIQLSTARTEDCPVKVVYAGLLGFPQGLEFAVESMEDMVDGEVEFHLYGEGVDRGRLTDYCKSRDLRHIHLHGHVNHEDYLKAIASADILYASLRPEKSLAAAMPSKIWEYMAAGKPVLFAGSGEASEAIERAQAGLWVRYGDEQDFQAKLRRLMRDPAYRLECGENGRQWVMKHQIRERINAMWVKAIADAFR